jgi:hypothetical protein
VAYAKSLSPQLEIEVLDVWLRYRSGDAELADEILQRASEEDNRRVGKRALERATRNSFTGVLQDHEVVGIGYSQCTDAVYTALLDGPAWRLRIERGLPAKSNLREYLDEDEGAFVMAAEALAAQRIRAEQRLGNQQCAEASARSAGYIREAIDRDQQDRRLL